MKYHRFNRWLFKVALTISLLTVSAVPAGTETRKLVKTVRDAFVFFSQGSGAVISADGLVLTNSHVLLDDSTSFKVRLGNGQPWIAELLGRDPFGDLALLQLKNAENLTFLPMADPDKVQPGHVCIAIGNPFALGLVDQQPTFSLGVVSAVHQLNGRYTDAVVTDVPINPGNSGGPLINVHGELIGINGMIRPSLGLRSNTGLAFAIPVNQIKLWIPRLRDSNGKPVYHGMIKGLKFERSEATGKRQAKVKSLGDDEKTMGFLEGDIITAINGETVWSTERFFGILGTYPEKTPMTVELMRGGKPVELAFDLPTYRSGKLYFSVRRPKTRGKYLVVSKVETDSPAQRAGLKPGDRLVQFQRYSMKGAPSYQYLIFNEVKLSIPPGSPILLQVERTVGGAVETKLVQYIAE